MAINTSQINDIYKNILGRSVDKSGLDWYSQMANDQGLDTVRKALSNSDEAKSYARTGKAGTVDMADRVDGLQYRSLEPNKPNKPKSNTFQKVMDLFVSNTGRADSGDVSSWVSRIDDGSATLEDLKSSLSGGGSPEPSAPASSAPQSSVSNQQTSQGQLDDILSEDSPLMQRASGQGRQAANSRGLLNSSMASQAAQGAMIDRATPLAQQDAQTHFQNTQANADRRMQDYMSDKQYGQQIGLNQQQYNQKIGLNQQQYGFDMDRLQASSTANAWGVMSNNITDIVAQSMDAINNIQANPNIDTENKSSMIEQILEMRDTDIEFQGGLYDSLSGYLRDTGLFPNL